MASMTPMMRQYLQLKEKYSDCLLFFRLGDFYEMFFDDAKTASRELELTLTGRDCGLEERAPMCGVPYHSVNTYITKLIDKGYKVAICEQLTDPALSQGLVERDVIRVITPGTVIETQMLNDKENNYIAAVYLKRAGKNPSCSIAYSDVSTGEFCVTSFEGSDISSDLFNELVGISPRELIANSEMFEDELLLKRIKARFYTEQAEQRAFDIKRGTEKLCRHFGVATLQGFGIRNDSPDIAAAGALLGYLEDTQKNALTHITRITKIRRSEFMGIDAATRRNLELTEPLRFDGSKKNTLLYVLDKTETAMGGRLLRKWIERPLQIEEQINERLNAVEAISDAAREREVLAAALSDVYDIERLCSRIAYGTVTPKDCLSLCSTLAALPLIYAAANSFACSKLQSLAARIDPMTEIAELLKSAINDDAGISVKDGNIIKSGYNAEVDELRSLAENGGKWLRDFESAEKTRTGIKTLKVSYNRVFGYYIEVSKSYAGSVPLEYQRKQTLANSERYITPQLKEAEEKILSAKENCIQLEYRLFTEIREKLSDCLSALKLNSAVIAELDAFCSFAKAAVANGYVRPRINTKGRISITDGRHPVVEPGMKDAFVPNSTDMNMQNDRLIILTGPNMAGKSTYMRQVALITLMAHLGSFVPAKAANICITDRIFTRVGASDSLSTGQSTFMVEMSEMANILNNATSRSLLIIDEIGRGTSTFDGLSIAWAVLEYISNPEKCGAKAHSGYIPFAYATSAVRGGADKSFGIQVAKLAGLPAALIERAKNILSELEASDINNASRRVKAEDKPTQMSMIGETGADADEVCAGVIAELVKMDADRMTPMEALSKLYELSSRVKIAKS